MIKNLIFDFGKVLVDYNFDHIVDSFFDDPVELMEFKRVVCGKEFIDRCDKEDIPFPEIIEDMKTKCPQWAVPIQLFYEHYLDFVTVEVPGMRNLLMQMRKEGYKLYGLTNWCSVVHQVIAKYDILQILDDRIISSEEHLLKPDVAIYQRLCEKFNVKAEECVFTDDKAENIEGARKAGMKGIVFKNAEQYERELRALIASNT